MDSGRTVADVNSAVLVVSCRAQVKRMMSCADTWVRELEESHAIPTIFVVGDPDLETPHDFDLDHRLLVVRAPDDYNSLSTKVQMAFRWVVENTDITQAFKCDDDTFINPQLFAAFRIDAPYIGIPMRFVEDPSLEYASGGSGYFLDASAMQLVVDDPLVPSILFEDVAVGMVMRKHGIPLRSLTRKPMRRLERQLVDGMTLISARDLWELPTVHLQRQPPRAMYLTFNQDRSDSRFYRPDSE